MSEAFVTPVVVGLVIVVVVALIVLSHFSDPHTRDDHDPGADSDIDDLLEP
jgi:hypothetical protein